MSLSRSKSTVGKVNIIYVMTIVVLLMIVGCIVRIAIPNKSYEYATAGVLYSEEEGYTEAIYENISLPIGLYKVSMEYELQEEDLPCYFYVRDGGVFTDGILCDGDVLGAGRTNTSCYMWLFESTESLGVYITVQPHTTECEYGTLTITETNGLWTAIIVNLVILWFVAVTTIAFFIRVRRGKISREAIFAVLALGIISIVGAIYFTIGTLPSGGDTGYHLERIESVAYSIRDGVFPIRLEAFYPYGYGYANGIMYCDISLYIPGLLKVAGFTTQGAFNLFGIICVVAGVVSTYVCSKRIFCNTYIAILAVALNNLAMYHEFDTVLRGGTGYLVASIFVPILVYGYYRLFSEDINERRYRTVWLPIAVCYSGILCSHVLSMEISALWTVIVLITMLPRVFRGKTFLELIKALGAVIALNLWFIVPFIDYYISENLHIKNVSARQIQAMGLDLVSFVRAPFQAYAEYETGTDGVGYQVFSTGVLALLLVFIALWIGRVWRPFKNVKFMWLAKICSVYSLVSIVLSLKIFPWDYLQSINPLFGKLISTIQFPFRFLGFADIFSTITICGLIWGVWQLKNEFFKYGVTAITVLLLLVYSVFFIEGTALNYNGLKLYDMTMQVAYLSGGEYAVEGTDINGIKPWVSAKTSETVRTLEYEKKDLAAGMSVINLGSEDGYVDVPLLHYKGYKAQDKAGNELSCVKSEDNYVRVIVPAGFNGSITVRFVSPWYWRVAEVIGYAAWIFVVLYVARRRREAKA